MPVTTPAPRRPRMAMLVGNHVVGDSRVEKAADSAAQAGYDVVVVGTAHRTVPHLGRYRDVPVLRVPVAYTRYRAWLTLHDPTLMDGTDWDHALSQDEATRVQRADPASEAPGGWAQATLRGASPHSLPDRLRGRLARTARTIDAWAGPSDPGRLPAAAHAGIRRLGRAAANLRAGRTQGWRHVWPMIADFEDAFLPALIELDPDIIHVHDRHPMPAVDAYSRYRAALGLPPVPWVYDAHEWIPGQAMVGPVDQRIGWKAMEAELIHRADAVLSVTEGLGDRMRDYHGLSATPSTVANAPWARRTPMDPDDRRPLRTECGLDDATPLLVYIGRVAKVRGVLTAVDALRHLPEVHLAFVASAGESQRAQIRDRALEVGVADRVHIVDYVPSDSVTWYVSSADIGLSPLLPTPAHESALATKLRECLLAGLPLVVSDLREQARFVTSQGVGLTHVPGDAQDLASAVREVLTDLPRFRAAVADPRVQDAHRWEASERVLTEVWSGLVPAPPATQTHDPATDTDALVQPLVLVGTSAAAAELLSAWRRSGRDGELRAPRPAPETPAGFVGSPGGLGAALSEWVHDDVRSAALVYDGTGPAAGRAEGSIDQEVRSLARRGRPVAVLAGDTPLADPRVRRRLVPGHPWRQLDTPTWERVQRQSRRAAQPILDAARFGAPVLTHSRIDAALVPDAVWLPRPVLADEAASSRGERTVLIVPAARTAQEQRAVAALVERLAADGVTVHAPSRARFERRGVGAWDVAVVVDALCLGEPSAAAEAAWGRGAVVIGGPVLHLDETAQADIPPVVETTPTDLVAVVGDVLAEDAAAFAARVESGLRYARAVHDPAVVADRLAAALGLADHA
ncbi:glycosyltransferase [Micrococcus luteus]|uniref:glycosyltransferase n=1 Tax=Micrococcus TaxID=1269 RepID=UPI0011A86B26|nr:glycosyltransferase [Micrococcus luteus]MCT1940761.1 glycosyltransferase [Micrococcus luteus]